MKARCGMKADSQVKKVNKRRYSKGPWRYGCDWGEHGAVADCGECSEYVYGGTRFMRPFAKVPPMEQHANAMLIARAPEMLELLQRAVAKGGRVNQRWNDKAETVIARATGTCLPERLQKREKPVALGQLLTRAEAKAKAAARNQPPGTTHG